MIFLKYIIDCDRMSENISADIINNITDTEDTILLICTCAFIGYCAYKLFGDNETNTTNITEISGINKNVVKINGKRYFGNCVVIVNGCVYVDDFDNGKLNNYIM